MLSLTDGGTSFGWDYEHEWPPEGWWERNRFLLNSPQAALTDRATDAAWRLIAPKVEEARAFSEQVRRQPGGTIFERVGQTIRLRRSGEGGAVDATNIANLAEAGEPARYRNPMAGVAHNVDRLEDALSDADAALATDSADGAAADGRLAELVGAIRETGFDDLLASIDRAESEEDMTRRVDAALRRATDLRTTAGILRGEVDVPDGVREPLDGIVAGLEDTLVVLAEIDRRRILAPAIRSLAESYRAAQAAFPTDRTGRKSLARFGRAMLPFFVGEYETLLEQIISAGETTARAEAIRDAGQALNAAVPRLDLGLAMPPLEEMRDEAERRVFEALRIRVLAVMRPALDLALARVDEIGRREAEGGRAR